MAVFYFYTGFTEALSKDNFRNKSYIKKEASLLRAL